MCLHGILSVSVMSLNIINGIFCAQLIFLSSIPTGKRMTEIEIFLARL